MKARFSYFLFPCILLLSLTNCSGFERSEKEKIRRQNCKGEHIYRQSKDIFYPIAAPEHCPRSPYPWESEALLPRITKDFFRCKGSVLNPSYVYQDKDSSKTVTDCEGWTRHGFPTILGKQTVYPVLIELLNYIQMKTSKRVIITCGHRCPIHNQYVDPASGNKTSKHQIGAEVDFYVQGLEDQPLDVVRILMQYYQEHPIYKHSMEWTSFQRYTNPDTDVRVAPWYNKEIFIKSYGKDEGRDKDNRHPYPYLSIQVRFDRDKKSRVCYNWEQANRGVFRN